MCFILLICTASRVANRNNLFIWQIIQPSKLCHSVTLLLTAVPNPLGLFFIRKIRIIDRHFNFGIYGDLRSPWKMLTHHLMSRMCPIFFICGFLTQLYTGFIFSASLMCREFSWIVFVLKCYAVWVAFCHFHTSASKWVLLITYLTILCRYV